MPTRMRPLINTLAVTATRGGVLTAYVDLIGAVNNSSDPETRSGWQAVLDMVTGRIAARAMESEDATAREVLTWLTEADGVQFGRARQEMTAGLEWLVKLLQAQTLETQGGPASEES